MTTVTVDDADPYIVFAGVDWATLHNGAHMVQSGSDIA
jgi:hypothetical protein